MKKIILMALLLLTLQACSSPNKSPAGSDREDLPPNAAATVTVDTLPVNTYTDGLPVPPPGTVNWTVLDEEHKNCAINLTKLQETDYDDYMEHLRQEGFSVVESVSEEIKRQDYISVCSLLSNDEKSLSISYIQNVFTICISFVN